MNGVICGTHYFIKSFHLEQNLDFMDFFLLN